MKHSIKRVLLAGALLTGGVVTAASPASAQTCTTQIVGWYDSYAPIVARVCTPDWRDYRFSFGFGR